MVGLDFGLANAKNLKSFKFEIKSKDSLRHLETKVKVSPSDIIIRNQDVTFFTSSFFFEEFSCGILN